MVGGSTEDAEKAFVPESAKAIINVANCRVKPFMVDDVVGAKVERRSRLSSDNGTRTPTRR
jgi:hypothetical protein